MSNKKQTSVELIIKEIDKQQQYYIDLAKKNKSMKKGVEAILTATTLLKMKCNQAKELHKQEIMDAVDYGCSGYGSQKDAEQYYNETYEQ